MHKNKEKQPEAKQNQAFFLLKDLIYYSFFAITIFIALEYMMQDPFEIRSKIIFLNVFLHFSCLLFVCSLIGNRRIGTYIYVILCWLFALTNYLVISFRSTPFMPWDIYSARTAFNVVDNYKMTFSANFIVSCIIFVLILFICQFSTNRIYKKARYRIYLLLSVFLLLFTFAYCRSDKVIKKYNLNTILFNSKVMSERNGHLLNFVFCTRYLSVDKPSGYSDESAKSILDSYAKTQESEPEIKPDIVVVMNESFSDLQHLKEFETNTDYMPFYRSFDENTKKGIVYSSVIGGNTATAEFEFLTGMSMGFLPSGSIAYLQFMHSPLSSLVSTLEGFGYQSTAMHPYYRSGWNREKVYDYFGFDKVKFNKEFVHQDKIRNYISDKSLFDEILLELDNKQDPQFIFTISMQNHGSYKDIFENFTPDVEITSQESSQALNQYLSLIKETDQELESFIKQISQRKRPTIVLFFGDHQPNNATVAPLTKGISEEHIQENRRKADYVLWANFPLPNAGHADTSINYLANDILDAAGFPKDKWYQFLSETRKEYPIMNDAYYFDAQGKLHTYDEKPFPDLLKQYSILQYDYLNEKKFGELR